MSRYAAVWVTLLLLVAASGASAQQLRADLGLTTERHGVSVNVDAHYYNFKYKLFTLGRIFMDEPDREPQPGSKKDNQITLEAAAGPILRKGLYIISPLAGIDSKGRVIAGGNLLTKIRSHTVAYLGYAKLATDSDHPNGMRHRIMFDLKKDQKVFLRMDWKTEGNRQEHCRLGAEFHTRIDKLNLPVYFEPFWNFVDRQPGIRIGTRL